MHFTGDVHARLSPGCLLQWLTSLLFSLLVAAHQVYKGIDQSTGGVVAIKEISLEGMSGDDLEGLQSEVNLLKGLNHHNVVQYLGTFKVRTCW